MLLAGFEGRQILSSSANGIQAHVFVISWTTVGLGNRNIHSTRSVTLYVSLTAAVGMAVQETFISADDLRVNLWNLNVNDQSFNVVDIKPANMEDLTEAHPIIFALGYAPL